ncbi:hypothetical protein AYK21_03125 [Thermoplasmatales archaeon SG8-52-2]|nr:MAG: hypothetical protein AYK21_03125 [Thermoplasmatales archaeon SG8-52-2]
MFYKDWEPIYEEIAKDFSYNLEKEQKSVEVLDNYLEKKGIFPLDKLDEIVKEREVIVFGAGPSLEKSLDLHKDLIKDCIKISADGATSALIKYDFLPDIIVTDLDGNVNDQINANSNGSVIVIHAHGDNTSEINKFVPKFKNNIIGSTQINPQSFENVFNFGGFTDGDRAVFLASHFKAKKIQLIGFDFNGEIGKYAYSEKKDKNLKIKKLKWCKKLIELLIKENGNIFYL